MCVEVDEFYKVKLNFNQSQRVSSNNYPKRYPKYDNGYYDSCTRRFYADGGAFKITFLDTRISLGDNIGIGMGLTPRFASTVYGSSAAAKSPSRGNHPRSVYVLPIPLLGYHLSDQGTFTPVSAQGGGSMEPPLRKTTFPPEFCNEICTIYVRVIKNQNSAKKKFKCGTVSKWRPNNRFLFRVISILAKF